MARSVVFAFLAALAFHAAVAIAFGGPADFDAWFHARYAESLRTGDVPWHGLAFPWLTCSAWADFPSDWALGWHWLVVPFTLVASDARTGLVFAQIVFAALLAAVFHSVLLRAEVQRAWTWTTLLLVGSAGWLWRTHQGRPTPLVVAALLLLVAATIERRALAAFGAALATMLLYCVPTMPVVVGACGVLGALARDRRVPWRTGFAVLGGVAAGVLLHPGTWSFRPGDAVPASVHVWQLFAGSIDFARQGGAFVADMGGGARAELQIALPSELGAPSWGVLLAELRLPLLATVAAVAFTLRRRRDAWAVGCTAAAVLACAMTLRSGRFFEYWHPFATLAAAVAVGRGLVAGAPLPAPRLLAAAMLLVAAAEAPQHVAVFRSNDSSVADSMAPAAEALRERAKAGDVVFHGAWDDFAPGWYQAPHVRWLTGMDPWFFVAHDRAKVAWHAAAVAGMLDDAELRRTLRERFGARFVLLWRRPGREDRYDALESALAAAPWARRIHRDAATSVFELR